MTRRIPIFLAVLGLALASQAGPALAQQPPTEASQTPLAISADGKLVAGATGRSVHLFDAATGKLLRHLRGHDGSVNVLTFSPDAKLLISAGEDKKCRVWDTNTGKETVTFAGHTTEVNCVAINSDGKQAVSCGNDQLIHLWDPATGKEVEVRNSYSGLPTSSIKYSPDGKSIAWSTGQAIYWMPVNQNQLNRNANSAFMVSQMAYVPGSSIIVTANTSRNIEMFDSNTGQRAATNLSAAGVPTSISCGGKLLAVAVPDTVQIFGTSAAERKELRKWTAKDVRGVALSADGKILLTQDSLGGLTLWDPETGKEGLRFGRYGVLPTLKADPNLKANALWEKLKVEDDVEAADALAKWMTLGDEGIKHLKEAIGPIKVEADQNARLKKLVVELDDESFAVREAATDALRGFGGSIDPLLREALRETESTEAKNRLRKLLSKKNPPVPAPEATRNLRVVVLLEGMGTPASRDLLAEIAKGTLTAPESRAAQAALARLEKK